MTSLNGESTPPLNDLTTSATAPFKRKRSTSNDILSSTKISGVTRQLSGFSLKLQNALPLLRKADHPPSLLTQPLTRIGERSQKRPKYSSENTESECVLSRIELGHYQTPEALLEDVDAAAQSLIESLQAGEPTSDPDSTTKTISQVTLFRDSLCKVCRHLAEVDTKIKQEHGPEEDPSLAGAGELPRPAVLTLTSQTDRGPKHLYSGLQQPKRKSLDDAHDPDAECVDQPSSLEPKGLPNGISFTEAAPSNVSMQIDPTKQKRTFNEVFRPHRSLKALDPPRPSKNATRGSSLGWVNHDELAATERQTPTYKSDYRYTSIPTGSWLHYSSADATAAPASDSKRRQRDRALSFGESRVEPPAETVEHELTRSKALFQSVYSSFAPSTDNSAAVVPTKTRSQMWWNKVGQKRIRALLALQYPLSDLDGDGSAYDKPAAADNEFEDVVASFEEETPDDELHDHATGGAEQRGVDDVLQEVSDLLHTLSSYQRIRNLSKSNSAHATPTSAESDVYEILRSNLVILVGSLPPYAVAKLSGDQLEALNISSHLIVDMKDHAGTMELDEYSLLQKRASMVASQSATARASASVGAASRAGNSNTPSASNAQRVSYSTARTPYGNQPRAMPSYGSTNTPQIPSYSAGRPAPMSAHRSGAPNVQRHATPVYSSGTSSSQFPRPSSALQNGYGPHYGNHNANSTSQAYTPQQRQPQPNHVYALGQSSHRSVPSPQPVSNPSSQGPPIEQKLPGQGPISSPPTFSVNNQVTMTEQARAQLQAQRQLSRTPQAATVNGQYASMVRSSTPSGGTPNGPLAVAAAMAAQGAQ